MFNWILSFHLIFIVCWFAGLFYLPRLFVYHTECQLSDDIGYQRFCTMERRLFFGIMTPSGILASFFGLWLLFINQAAYIGATWIYIKLVAVACLWVFHLYCGGIVFLFKHNKNTHSARYYRILNEAPTLFLFLIIILAVVKP